MTMHVLHNRDALANPANARSPERDIPKKDLERYSLCRLISSLIQEKPQLARLEHEVAAELFSKSDVPGLEARGFSIPPSILNGRRDLEAGSATKGDDLVATDLLGDSFIATLRNQPVALRAGATVLP